MKLKIPFHMNAPQKIVSTEMLLDSKIRWGAPSIHFEEPLKKTSLVSASREKGGGGEREWRCLRRVQGRDLGRGAATKRLKNGV